MIKTLKVTEVNNYIKKIMESDYILKNIKVSGEISNFKLHSSGHIYFSLKDEGSKINCIMFRGSSSKLNFKPEDGMNIIVMGRVSLYVRDGSYQLYVEDMEIAGEGELYKAFNKLKDKLYEEGLFSPKYKNKLPLYAQSIGVITSPTGAAIKDIINVCRNRNSSVKITIFPALVQGIGSSDTIISGIRKFNQLGNVDIIIIARGGGSIEELWSFNDELLAREIFKSKIPIITGIGHETDFTIADFVSDVRASTPSQAAEFAVFREQELKDRISNLLIKLENGIKDNILLKKHRGDDLLNSLNLISPRNRLLNESLTLSHLKEKLSIKMKNIIENNKNKTNSLYKLLDSKGPIRILSRGYSIIEDNRGNVIYNINDLANKDEIIVRMIDGMGKFNIKEKK